MEPMFFVLAIMGCGDGATMCSEARVEPARYATAAQCQAALPAALQRNSDVDFPVISAACKRQGLIVVDRRVAAPRG